MTPAELREQITKLIAEDGEILHILERIAQKSADFGDSQNYMLKSGEISGAEFAKYVCGMGADERSAAVFGILWDRYKDGCGIFGGIQAIIDEKQGVHVAAQYADFPEVRAKKMANALCDPEAGDETIKRRAESAGNIVAAMHDDNTRANAEFRSRAGFTVHAQRIGGAECCEWCASVSGKYPASDTPQDFWGRHDKCKCTILYDSKRGRQTLRGTGKRWTEQPAEGAGAAEPVTLTAEQARAAEGKNGLTKPVGSGTISLLVDKFVPCLMDSETGEILQTEAARVPRKRLSAFTEANGWGIDWVKRPKDEYVMGIFLKGDANPQGLISLRKDKGGIYMGFASTAPQNNKQLNNGQQKYVGVGGHLFAIAIQESLRAGSGGCVYGFAANEELLRHYVEKLGAEHLPIQHPYQIIIEGEAAQNILNTYNFERRKRNGGTDSRS